MVSTQHMLGQSRGRYSSGIGESRALERIEAQLNGLQLLSINIVPHSPIPPANDVLDIGRQTMWSGSTGTGGDTRSKQAMPRDGLALQAASTGLDV